MTKSEQATLTTVAKINNTEIVIVEDGEKRIPIRPICEALGIAPNGQIEKIKTDPILGSTGKTVLSVGADEKEREMFTIPFKFVFGWLFRIDSRNVKKEARDKVERYQLECYNALYNHFTGYAEFIEQKEKLIETQLQIVEDARKNFKNTKSVLDDANGILNAIRKLTFADYDAERRQLMLFDKKGYGGLTMAEFKVDLPVKLNGVYITSDMLGFITLMQTGDSLVSDTSDFNNCEVHDAVRQLDELTCFITELLLDDSIDHEKAMVLFGTILWAKRIIESLKAPCEALSSN